MVTFKSLFSVSSIKEVLKESHKYLAHTPGETLEEHMTLVGSYFLRLVDTHDLESLIDKRIKEISPNEKIQEFLKTLFWEGIWYHDFGKVNENFQRDRMENVNLFPDPADNGIQHHHAVLSAFIYLVHGVSDAVLLDFDENDRQIILPFMMAIAQNILRHHSRSLGDLSDKKTFSKLTNELCEKLECYLTQYKKEYLTDVLPFISNNLSSFSCNETSFHQFFISRIHFSLLTAADYYATAHFHGKWKEPYQQLGVLAEKEKEHLINNLKTLQSHNKALFNSKEEIVNTKEDLLKEKSFENLNKLRSKLAAEVLQNISANHQHKLFYIEAPTGGGKTNLSMIGALSLLELNPELNKIFYVFPFTTLITQTVIAAKDAIGISDNQYIELHGKAGFKIKEEEEAGGLYGESKLDDIHNQFVNYPITFLTHIRFFDILVKNQKDAIYLMHRLANSVVIIDEVQAYNPLLWDKMAYLLKEYAEALNTRFIVMSATLPKIGQLSRANFITLVPDAIERFFKNPNFCDRVTFDGSWLEIKRPNKEEKRAFLENLADKIKLITEEYKSKTGSVRAIVEFIFKKSASDFAKLAEEKFSGYHILLLSGTVLESRRKEIINYLKNPDASADNVLLVTTQVVEAGVDIDMDLGFKDRSLIDSEEQLAGRVNRNVKKQNCKVYLFDLDDASIIYGSDLRYKELKRSIESEYLEILSKKQFDKVYEKVTNWLEENNQVANMGGNLTSYTRAVETLNFPKVDHDFQLIKQNNVTVFVPLELPLTILSKEGKPESTFTKHQLDFLKSFNISTNSKLSGSKVFDLYKELITVRSKTFSDRKRDIKQIQSILAQFTFSLFAESGIVKELIAGGNREEFGYLYLQTHTEVYDYKLGLRDDQLDNLIFL